MTPGDIELETAKPKRVVRINLMTNRGECTINMPIGRIVQVGFGSSGIGVVYLWVETYAISPAHVDRKFIAAGDYEVIPPNAQYIGTAHDQSFSRTWHIYEVAS